ncbi:MULTISPECIES: MBL fold metallo-hydrolase [Streptomyces]|uniref:MBL fold metallo-hydrolase n=1 Tax=Streptomyces TaxID=1883 RepID=UPI001F0E7F14|nr:MULTISPECIES: MBL fold metallo-hydrolase [Streptomyces]
MQLTVLGGCGAWPTAVQACSGYLVEYAGFRLLIDPGYATLPRLLEHRTVDSIDAVLISHGHPDHCADLNPLLRARGLSDTPPPSLPVYAPHGAADAVLALDKPSMLAEAYRLREFQPGDRFDIGPFETDTWLLPHFVPNAGIRLTTPDAVLAYTGDTGPSRDILRLAEGADLLLSEATYGHERLLWPQMNESGGPWPLGPDREMSVRQKWHQGRSCGGSIDVLRQSGGPGWMARDPRLSSSPRSVGTRVWRSCRSANSLAATGYTGDWSARL